MTKRMEEMRNVKQPSIEIPSGGSSNIRVDQQTGLGGAKETEQEVDVARRDAHSPSAKELGQKSKKNEANNEDDDEEEEELEKHEESSEHTSPRVVMLSAQSMARFAVGQRDGGPGRTVFLEAGRSYGLDLVRSIANTLHSTGSKSYQQGLIIQSLKECLKSSGFGTANLESNALDSSSSSVMKLTLADSEAPENNGFVQGMFAGVVEFLTEKKVRPSGESYNSAKNTLTLNFVKDELKEDATATKPPSNPATMAKVANEESPEPRQAEEDEDSIEVEQPEVRPKINEDREAFLGSDPQTREAVIDTVRAIQDIKRKIALRKEASNTAGSEKIRDDDEDYEEIEDLLSSI